MYIRLYKSFIIVIVIVIVIIIIIIPDRWSKNKHINSRSKSVVWRAASRSLARLQITLFQIPSEEIEMINDQETHWKHREEPPERQNSQLPLLWSNFSVLSWGLLYCTMFWCTSFNIKKASGTANPHSIGSTTQSLSFAEDYKTPSSKQWIHPVGRSWKIFRIFQDTGNLGHAVPLCLFDFETNLANSGWFCPPPTAWGPQPYSFATRAATLDATTPGANMPGALSLVHPFGGFEKRGQAPSRHGFHWISMNQNGHFSIRHDLGVPQKWLRTRGQVSDGHCRHSSRLGTPGSTEKVWGTNKSRNCESTDCRKNSGLSVIIIKNSRNEKHLKAWMYPMYPMLKPSLWSTESLKVSAHCRPLT